LEQVLQTLKPSEAFFWATHSGAEIDLFFLTHGRRLAIEVKFNEAPHVTRSMRMALDDLGLDHLWIIYPGQHVYPVHARISVWPLQEIAALPERIT
jgi:predicted AAA+ superfamily ATPase